MLQKTDHFLEDFMKDWFFQTSSYFIVTVISSIIYCCVTFAQHNLILRNLCIFHFSVVFLVFFIVFFFYQWRNLGNKIKSSVQSLPKQFYFFPSSFSSPVSLRYILFLFHSCWLITILTAFFPFSVCIYPLYRKNNSILSYRYIFNKPVFLLAYWSC